MKMSHLVDDEDLLQRLAVECFDTEHHRVINLSVALSDSCVNDLFCRESAAVGMKHFIAADAVCSEALAADVFEKSSLDICLDCIVHLDVMPACKFGYMVNCLSEQFHVVIVEWGRDLVESLYGVDIQHFI